MEFKISFSIEKVIEVSVNATDEEEAIEKAKDKLMNGREDFAQILDTCVNNE